MRRRGLALCLAVLVTGCAAPAGSPAPTPLPSASEAGNAVSVRIASASDLRYAMDDLIASWNAANPGRTARASYGSSGNFFAQIRAGAPFDLFFSADAAYPRELERAGLATAGSTRLYAIGQIVAWVGNASTLDVEARGLAALADPAVRTVAIANPEHAPYGRAAVAALRSAGIYDDVAARLVLGESVSQAAQFVESGSADAGIIALSLALAPPLAGQGRWALAPIDAYPRLEQGAVVLGSAGQPVGAAAFLDFVLGPDGRAVLERYGFLMPPG